MSSSQNSDDVPSSQQDLDFTIRMFESMNHVQWNVMFHKHLAVAFDEEQVSFQKKMVMERLYYMKNNIKYIDSVKVNIGTEKYMLTKQLIIINRHIVLFKAQESEAFKMCLEYAKYEHNTCSSIMSLLVDIEIEFQGIGNYVLKEQKTPYNDLKQILQNPTCVENYYWRIYYKIADLFKRHEEICRAMADRYLTYSTMCLELENIFQNKVALWRHDALHFVYLAAQFKKDSEALEFYANVLLLHKENSNANNIWFADFPNKTEISIKNLRDLVVKQIETNGLRKNSALLNITKIYNFD